MDVINDKYLITLGKGISMTFEKLRSFWKRNKRSLYALFALIGLIFMLLGLMELLILFDIGIPKDYEPPFMDKVGYGSWFFVFIGGIVMIGGWLYFYDYNKKHKRFEELMDTNSKASFVRNVVEIEELAIDLGPDYEDRVIKKREQLKVKTR
jgi:hypothetical protein